MGMNDATPGFIGPPGGASSTATVARGIIGGIAGAAGDPQTQQEMVVANQRAAQQKQAELQAKVAPLSLGIKNLQTGIQDAYGKFQQANPDWKGDFDSWKTGPGAQQFGQFVDQTSQATHALRQVLHPDWQPGPDEWLKTHLTDRMHITNADHRAEDRANSQQWNQYTEQQGAQRVVAGVNPNPLSPQDQVQAARYKAGLIPPTKTNQEQFVANYVQTHPGASQEEALQHYTDATNKTIPKAPKGLEVNEKGGVFLGVKDGDTGKDYLPSQLGPDGDAPPAAKEMWGSVQSQKAAKEADEEKKENTRVQAQMRTIGASFERLGMTQLFQEKERQFGQDLMEYRKLNDAAVQSKEQVDALANQYKEPGNKAAVDNELVNFFTSVTQKGGRKTAAELKLTSQIGSFGMNMDQMYQKAKSGELPPELRRELLNGMDAVAREQKKAADENKPELPAIPQRGGTKQKQVMDTRSAQPSQRAVGDKKTFPNGKTGVWDGQGWLQQAAK